MKKNKPLYFVSLKTGNKYDYEIYSNHGKGNLHSALVPGFGTITRNDLPKDEYPYTIEYERLDDDIKYDHGNFEIETFYKSETKELKAGNWHRLK